MLQNEEIEWMEQKKLICIFTHVFIFIKNPNTSLNKNLPKNPNNCVSKYGTIWYGKFGTKTLWKSHKILNFVQWFEFRFQTWFNQIPIKL